MTNLVGGSHGAIYDTDAKSERITIRFTDRTNPRLANYRPLTTGIDLEWRIEGVPAIERFAKDQKGRDYLGFGEPISRPLLSKLFTNRTK